MSKSTAIADVVRKTVGRAADASSAVPPSVLHGSAAFKKAVPGAKQAAAFVQRLAPDTDLIPGVNLHVQSVAAAMLPKAASEVLELFTRARTYVESEALSYGVLKDPVAIGRAALGGRPSLHPAQLEAAIKKATGGKDAAVILQRASDQLDNANALKAPLADAAAAWRSRGTAAGFKAATKLRPVEYPQPKAPTAGQQAAAAAKESAAQAASREAARQRVIQEALQVWDRAPVARGWGANSGLREVAISTDWLTHTWPVDDVRALTREQWVANRLRQANL